MGLGFSCLGHDEQAAGVLVYAVNQPYLRTVDVVLREVFEVPGYGIQHGAVPIAESRVDDHACRLVYDHEVVVFVDDANGYILWRKGILFRKGDTDFIPFLDEVARRRRLSIDGADAVVFDPAPQRR